MDINYCIEQTAIDKLKNNTDAPDEEFIVIPNSAGLLEFRDYVKRLVLCPEEAERKVRKILLLYIASVHYVVMSFDPEQYMDTEIVNACDNLAKTLYLFYKDINTILRIKQIEYLWKTYIKLCNTASKVPTSSSRKVSASRDRIIYELHRVAERIKRLNS